MTRPRFEARGRRLWTALHRGVKRDPATDILIEEACRIADRLDRLDRILSGDAEEWLTITERVDTGQLVLKVNPVLAEARQQASTLHRLVSTLQTKPESAQKGDAFDDLVARLTAGPSDPAAL